MSTHLRHCAYPPKTRLEVNCGIPEQFRELVGNAGLPFYGLSEKFLEVIEGDAAKSVMGRKVSVQTDRHPDQALQRLHHIGAGPKGNSIHKLNDQNLEP